MQFNKYTHSRAPLKDQCEWHIMTRVKESGVECDNTHTHITPWEDQCEWHRMNRMTAPDCAAMCNLINTYTHLHTNTYPRDEAGILQQRTIAVAALVAPRVTCSYLGGSKGFASSLLLFSWGAHFRVALCDPGWTYSTGARPPTPGTQV